MKFKTLLIACVLVPTTYAQMTATTQSGKSISSPIDYQQNDVVLNIPIPKNIEGHDLIQMTIAIESKTDNFQENSALRPYSTGVFYRDFKPEALKDKSAIKMTAINGSGKTDFVDDQSYGGPYQFTPAKAMSNSKRTEEMYNLNVRVFAKDISGYEWQDDGFGNRVQEPTYTFTELKRYTVEYNGGKPAEGIASTNRTIVLPKVDQDQNHVFIQSAFMNLGMSNKATKIEPTDRVYIASNKTDKNQLYFEAIAAPKSAYSVEKVKDIVLENLVHDANSYGGHRSMFHGSDIVYLPELCYVNADTEVKEEKGGSKLKSRLNQLKSDLSAGSGGKVTEADLEKKQAYAKEHLQWTTENFGGISCQKLDLNVYTKQELKANSNRKVYEVDGTKEGNTRPLELFVGESEGFVFVAWIFKQGESSALTDAEKALKRDIMSGVAFQ